MTNFPYVGNASKVSKSSEESVGVSHDQLWLVYEKVTSERRTFQEARCLHILNVLESLHQKVDSDRGKSSRLFLWVGVELCRVIFLCALAQLLLIDKMMPVIVVLQPENVTCINLVFGIHFLKNYMSVELRFRELYGSSF